MTLSPEVLFCRGSREGCVPTDHGSRITDHSVRAGFTLLELLIVIGIVATLVVLIGPAFTTITSATGVMSSIYGVKGTLENARAYAKANHTYVFVGFSEVNSSIDPSVSPQITTGDTPYGRVAVAVVASKDGNFTIPIRHERSGQRLDS